MSTGKVTQFTDFSNTGGSDTGTDDAASIQPFNNGEDVEQTPLRRPSENLRLRTEVVRGLFDDTLYLRDADRALLLAGPGLVSWPGSTTASFSGIPTLSDNVYLMPFLTPGAAQTAPVPPVASTYGSLVLKNAGNNPGVTVASLRRSYAGGDKINITVVAGGAPGTVSAVVSDTPQRTIVLTANTPTLNQVISLLNGLMADSPATQLVNATLAGGALGTDLLLVPQAKQYIAGNYDGEGHALTPAALASFFSGNPGSALAEGDTLCIQYAQMVDANPLSVSGRRQALPENSNTAVPAASFFNSRVNPDKLVNAIPVCKVVNGRLIFISGAQVPAGATNVDLGSGSASDLTYAGGPNWADGTPNPATTVESQLDKIVSDLASETGSGGTDKVGAKAFTYSFGSRSAETLAQRIAGIEGNKPNLGTNNAFTGKQSFAPPDETDANAPLNITPVLVTAYRPVGTFQGASCKMRIYIGGADGFVVTSNAIWIPSTAKWHQENPAYRSTKFQTDYNLQQTTYKSAAAGADWLDNAWDATPDSLDLGTVIRDIHRLRVGADNIGSQAAAAVARVSSPAFGSGYTLMHESVAAGGRGMRLYSHSNGSMYLATNAFFDQPSGNFKKDVPGDAALFAFIAGQAQVVAYYSISGSGDPPGTIMAWTGYPLNAYWDGPAGNSGGPWLALLNGIIDLSPPVEGAHGSPLGSTSIANKVTSKNLVKSWFYGKTNGSGGWTLQKGFNCTTSFATFFGVPYIDFHMPSGLNFDYMVLSALINFQSIWNTIFGLGIFDVNIAYANDFGGTYYTPAASGGLEFALIVVGTQI